MQIAIGLYPGFTALDAIGPYQVFTNLPGAEVVLCAERRGALDDDNALLHLEIDHTFADVSTPDILLVPGGLVVATVPSPQVDEILRVLMRLRILDGMEKGLAEQHHGFDPADTTAAFERAGFTLVRRKRFQFGLNNLFVLRSHGSR